MNQVKFYTLDVRHILDTFNNSLAQATDEVAEAKKKEMEFKIKMSRGEYKLLHGLALIHNAYHLSLNRKSSYDFDDYPIFRQPYIENVEGYVKERVENPRIYMYTGFSLSCSPYRWRMTANSDVEEGHEREFIIRNDSSDRRGLTESKMYTIDEFLLFCAEKYAEQAARKNNI